MPNIEILSGPCGIYYKPLTGAQYLSLGHTDKDGVIPRMQIHGHKIMTAMTGDAPMDGVYTGKSMTLHMTLIEAKNTMVRQLLSHNAVASQDEGRMFASVSSGTSTYPVGQLWSAMAGSLRIIPLRGTLSRNLQSDGIGNALAFRVVVENDTDIEMRMNANERSIPVVLRVIPFIKEISGGAEIRLWDWVNVEVNLTNFNFASAPSS